MHKAPTVDYPVGPSLFQSLALLFLWSSVAGVDVLWWLQSDRVNWRHAAGAILTLGAAAMAFRAWRLRNNGVLQWDGQAWWWDAGGIRVSGELKSRLDLQSVLLLDFRPHTGSRKWLWLERKTAPSRWSALRRAVHAPEQGETFVMDAGSPVAKQTHRGGIAPW